MVLPHQHPGEECPSMPPPSKTTEGLQTPAQGAQELLHLHLDSILSKSITTWMGSTTKHDHLTLRRVVRSAERIIRTSLPNLQNIYIQHSRLRARRIASDLSYPKNGLFSLLPLGRCYFLLRVSRQRMRRSFFPQVITLRDKTETSPDGRYSGGSSMGLSSRTRRLETVKSEVYNQWSFTTCNQVVLVPNRNHLLQKSFHLTRCLDRFSNSKTLQVAHRCERVHCESV